MQTLAVIILIGVAAYFVVRRFIGLLKGGGSPCGCCADSDKCGEQQQDKGTPLEDHRKDTS
ncbi:MAG: FeoB-associated Cys-rich membrane protein [Desulfohalobiaceae bacterium]